MPRASSPLARHAPSFPRLAAQILFPAALITSCVLGGTLGLRPDKDGRTVYLEACASCHGAGGKGDGPVARALTKPPADLTRLAERHGGTFPRQQVLEVITGDRAILAHGDREMPVWSQRFFPSGSGATVGASIYRKKHLERILTYLESIQQNGGPNASLNMGEFRSLGISG